MIRTERLILRPPVAGDRPALYAMWGDPLGMADLGGAKDKAACAATLARHAGYAPLGFGVVERCADGRVVGHVGLKPGAPDTPIVGLLEIGWIVARPFWGSGYAREAAQGWLDWAWANRAEPAVYAITARRNVASRRLMERLGMRHVPAMDFLHPAHSDDPDLADSVTYRIDRP
ncbi:RimJ/RimL family protein N-acetyltransferase [Sphingomonas sp. BE138]|uniref:GNAT family N-acetyltransferase n=1 Tax=Sphingomonas sp. BE138 TaxID=2817845 RepID=UPI00286465A8|nr:GNAT family N-acetyltransferase [Sphingomonas sp. BE138]MDR6787271.1 RimJ/RimL family protein N-acetyltransferase [Sphingomonas sp. BE138]